MNYIIYALALSIILFILSKFLGFIFKILFFFVVVATAIILYKSTKSPILLFNTYRVDNLMVEKVK
ncbi:hypothetical protein ACFLZ4_00075 [Patescibacteria group bacterium]